MGQVAWRITILVLLLMSRYALGGPGHVDPEYGRCHERGAAVAISPDLKPAIAAYDRGEYSAAYQQFYTLANQGNAAAQYYVGCLHDGFHLGMTQDYAIALRWYRAAAEQGHAEAQVRLGNLYAKGRGVPQDLREATRWYQAADRQRDAAPSSAARARQELQRLRTAQGLEAAIAAYERGDYATAFAQFNDLANERGPKPSRRDAAYYQQLAKAQYWLGLLYEKGQGVAQDYKQAATWYRAASNSGNADAAFNLAVLYEHGRGVAPDVKQAFDHYAAAQARGHADAAAAVERLRHQFHHPSEATAQLSAFDAAVAAYDSRNYALATKQFLALAQAGQVDAQLYLGELYERRGGSPDEAIRWFRAAAEQGDAEGQHRLAQIYRSDRLDRDGRRKWTDYAEAVRWFRAAAEQGHPGAQMEVGQAYREGRGVAGDREEANRWYQTSHKNTAGLSRLIEPQCAALSGVAEYTAVYAACNRGDKEETFRQLTVLAKQGNARAHDWLGYWHYQGLTGIQKGRMYIAGTSHGYFQRAARFTHTAAEQGYAPAQYNLGVVYEHGMGVAVNAAEAARWYRAAAGMGLAQAQAALARLGK